MTTIENLHVSDNGILFNFEQEVNAHGMFNEDKVGMIQIIQSVDSSVNTNRWCKILKAGPGMKDPALVVGARVLIQHLQWSRAIKLANGTSVWKTDETKILAVDEE